MRLALRRVSADDARLLWEWRNDALVRENAFTQDVIAWDTHCAWFAGKRASTDCRIWILEHDGRPAGQVRYDRVGAIAEIDYSIAESFRGAGLGARLLQMSGQLGCSELVVSKLIGLVKPGNAASVRSFERAGFQCVNTLVRRQQPCLQFERHCGGAKAREAD